MYPAGQKPIRTAEKALEKKFKSSYGNIILKRHTFDSCDIDELKMDIINLCIYTKDHNSITFDKLLVLRKEYDPYLDRQLRYLFTTDIFYRIHQFQSQLGVLHEGCYSHLDRYCKNLPYKDKICKYIIGNSDPVEELAIILDKDVIEDKMKSIGDEYKELVRSLMSTDDNYRLISTFAIDDFLYRNDEESILKFNSHGIIEYIKETAGHIDIPNVFDTLLDYNKKE